MVSILFLLIAIGCYSIKELQAHNKLKWQNEHKNYFSFWGRNSWVRKYKREGSQVAIFKLPTDWRWYYKAIGSKYKERWFTSTWLTVALTDGYHLCQFFFLLFVSLSVSIPLDTRLSEGWEFGIVWAVVHLVHFLIYKLLQR